MIKLKDKQGHIYLILGYSNEKKFKKCKEINCEDCVCIENDLHCEDCIMNNGKYVSLDNFEILDK